MGRLVPWFERVTKPFNEKLVKHKEDAFLVNFAVYAGLGLPLLLWTFGRLHLQYGESTVHALLLGGRGARGGAVRTRTGGL